jgi:hypothetical protein
VHRKFLKFYDQYFDDVYRFVYFKTGSRWDTDDLASDIFRKVNLLTNEETVKRFLQALILRDDDYTKSMMANPPELLTYSNPHITVYKIVSSGSENGKELKNCITNKIAKQKHKKTECDGLSFLKQLLWELIFQAE